MHDLFTGFVSAMEKLKNKKKSRPQERLRRLHKFALHFVCYKESACASCARKSRLQDPPPFLFKEQMTTNFNSFHLRKKGGRMAQPSV